MALMSPVFRSSRAPYSAMNSPNVPITMKLLRIGVNIGAAKWPRALRIALISADSPLKKIIGSISRARMLIRSLVSPGVSPSM